jgi:hypothetical protein
MPRATVTNDTERFDLKSCPEGYITLKRLTYGQLLERREMSTQMLLQGQGNSAGGELKVVQRAVAEFEFKHCIVDHNLEDDNGELINFSRPGVVMTLDPRVGEEIGQLIDKMNQFEADQGNF